MKKFSFYILISMVSVTWLSCSKGTVDDDHASETIPDMIQLTDAQMRASEIVLGDAQIKPVPTSVSATGVLDVPPQNMVDISVPFGGFVKNTRLLQGMRVKRGEVLVTLQHPDYIQLQQDYLNSESQLRFLEAEYNRQVGLAKENVNAQKTVEQASAAYEGMRATVQGLKARLSLLNLSAGEIRENGIKNTIQLRSPINGYVTNVNVNVGKYVSPTDAMITIVDTEHMHAELHVFEKDVMGIRKGQKVNFRLINDSTIYAAKVHLVGKTISDERTIRVHCHLEKEEPDLLPGMFIHATIEIDKKDMIVLPDEAVVQHEGKSFVFLPAENNNGFKLTEVKTILQQDGFTALSDSSAVKANSQVVVKGAYTLLSLMLNMADDGHH